MGDRVLLLLGPSTGGIRRHVSELQSQLRRRGWDVAAAGPPGVLDDGTGEQRAVHIPSDLAPRQAVEARGQLAALVDDVDLVHAHGLKAGWIASTLRPRRPLVVTVHNLVLREAAGASAPVLQWLEGRLPSRSDAVIAVSEEIADRFGRPSNTTVIPPVGPEPVVSRDRSAIRAELGVGPAGPLAVTVARLHPQKDVPTFLRAIASLPGTHAAVVGTGPLDGSLRALAESLGIVDRVHFTGQLANPADVMAAADVVVVSSVWESGPLALVEAMMLGRPVVTTPVGLAPRLVLDGETGRVFAIGDVGALSSALEWILSDDQRAAAMGERGRARVRAELGPEQLVGATEAVYRSVLDR